MSKLLQIGISFAKELPSGIGHVACTLGGVDYECRGGKGCLKGSAARGATNMLFKHQYVRVLSDAQANKAKEYANSCVGQPYVWGGMPSPTKGGDCSGYMSGIICAATGVSPRKRLFGTGTWLSVFKNLGFTQGLAAPGAVSLAAPVGAPPPMTIDLSDLLGDIKAGRKTDKIVAIQKALNKKVGSKLQGLGIYGPKTKNAYSSFQHMLGFHGDVNHPGSDADGIPGKDSLQKLGFRVVS